jgi:O-antigen/teichoic acid export membrane protein
VADLAPRQFGTFLRAAGKLAAARQISALLFVGAVLGLSALAPRPWVTDFVWAYFAMLTLTSVLGLGFERLAGTLTAEHTAAGTPAPLGSLVLLRLATAPLAALGLWALLAFVGVALPPLAWWATLAWIVAALVSPVAFGALRATGNSATEPRVAVLIRSAQAAALLAAAAGGATVTAALVVVAALEAAGAAMALRALGRERLRRASLAELAQLPWRRVVALAGIELVALAYLRADLLLVGRILGPVVGATYGMLYRVIDGMNGAVGSVGLWLYAESANARDGDINPFGIRARSLALLPRLAIGVGLVMILGSAVVAAVTPSLASDARVLQLLLAAFPLLTVNAIELHVRSGRGRNREVLRIGVAALLLNVPLCLILVPALGLRGAAIALVASESLQSVLLVAVASRAERSLLRRSMATAVGGAILLLIVGVATRGSGPEFPLLGMAAALFLIGIPLYRRAMRASAHGLQESTP